ncbi:FAP237 [Auxenochlorella protothecoides x Auxenochlorella symbiontica]
MLVIPPDVSPRLRYTSLIATTQISSPSCSEQHPRKPPRRASQAPKAEPLPLVRLRRAGPLTQTQEVAAQLPGGGLAAPLLGLAGLAPPPGEGLEAPLVVVEPRPAPQLVDPGTAPLAVGRRTVPGLGT